jgi:hypothetical protein
MWEPQPPGILMVHPGLYRNCLIFYVTYGVEEWNVCMAHWKNASEGGNLVRTRKRKGFPFIKMTSYICYCWTTKWPPIFATVDPQSDVLYLLLLNDKMTSYICYCWMTKWPPIFATVQPQSDVLYLLLLNHKMTSYICYCWMTKWRPIFATVNHKITSYICCC